MCKSSVENNPNKLNLWSKTVQKKNIKLVVENNTSWQESKTFSVNYFCRKSKTFRLKKSKIILGPTNSVSKS